MSVTTTNDVVINKMTLAQYKTLKANNQINVNEVYVISDVENHIMTAYLSSNVTISSANASAYTAFTLSKYESTGDKLTISNGAIRVGAGVSRIKVSAQAQLAPNGGAGIKHLRVYKNTASVGWAMHRCTATNENTTLSVSTRVLSATEGDMIYLKYYGLAGDVFSGNGDIPTMLTVEVVE